MSMNRQKIIGRREIGTTKEAQDIIRRFADIVQCQLAMRALDYHASHSLVRMAMSNPNEYHDRRKSLRKSCFVVVSGSDDDDDDSSLVFQPTGGECITVNRIDCCKSGAYAVSIPQRIPINRSVSGDLDATDWGTEFDDNPTQTESCARHPGTHVDSDIEEDQDYDTLYPEYRSDQDDAPITTVAAEELACLVFVGGRSRGQTTTIKGELQAAYPLQLSARIDQSRKCLIFDCFEYKPYQLIDLSQEDISAALPTERGWQRWIHGYHWSQVDEDDEWDDSVEGTEYWGGDAQMEGSNKSRDSQELAIYCGLTGHFAYNRCLRYRLPFDNICGVRLQVDADATSNKTAGVVGGDATAMLVLELSRPPPPNAFATRKVNSRWQKENNLEIIHDWTPDKSASQASRIYMYGGLKELRQTAALMATKSSRLAKMLKSVNEPTNSLREETSIEYTSSPALAVDKSVQYGMRVTNRRRRYEDLTPDEKQELRSDPNRNTICSTCGSVFFTGYSGLACPNCGDGKWTIDRHWDPVSAESFNGVIDKVAQFEKPKDEGKQEDESKEELKRKSPG